MGTTLATRHLNSGTARCYIITGPKDFEQIGEEDKRLSKHSVNDIKDVNRLPADG